MADINRREQDKILEPTDANLLRKLVSKADNYDEAVKISLMGTTLKRTGLLFNVRLEKTSDKIHYFKKDTDLSFTQNPTAITHKLIIGDNYPALLNLLIEYKNRVDVIYIDPPYASNSMGEFARTNYQNNITRDNLLSMLYPRLQLAKRLLSPNGVIFCSIDDKNQAYVKCLFDDVFGESNFENSICWRRRSNQPNDDSKMIATVMESVIVYAKNSKNIKESHSFGKVQLSETRLKNYTNPDNDPMGEWSSTPWCASKGQGGTRYTITTPTGITYDEVWLGTQETFQNLLNENRIIFPNNQNGKPRKKIYKDERLEKGQSCIDLWIGKEYGDNLSATNELKKILGNERMFDNPKPIELIQNIVKVATTNNEAIVLDFFAGSGTTGQAVLELNKQDGGNRQYICVQLPEDLDEALKNAKQNKQTIENQIALCDKYHRPHELSEITAERLRRVMTGKCYDGSSDFEWIKKKIALGGNLDVYRIQTVKNCENKEKQTPFDVIDETLYGQPRFSTLQEKIEWVCSNFEGTQKTLETAEQFSERTEKGEK